MRYVLNVLGWGVVIYALMYLLWSGLVIYGLAAGAASLLLRILGLAVITTFAAQSLRLHHWHDVLPYSFSWGVISVLLDGIFLVPFSGWALYTTWSVWVGYALVVLIPLASHIRLRTPRIESRNV